MLINPQQIFRSIFDAQYTQMIVALEREVKKLEAKMTFCPQSVNPRPLSILVSLENRDEWLISTGTLTCTAEFPEPRLS